ncbi:MAG: hypothetical protein HRU15_09545 [Planctomycetes bacterium]|nr:hypothetical protein [Planctomycetota bacterium]
MPQMPTSMQPPAPPSLPMPGMPMPPALLPNMMPQPPQLVGENTAPPGPESEVESFFINEMKKNAYGKIGKNWSGYFKKSRRMNMSQDSQAQTPPEYENQAKQYFKAISEATEE